MQYSLEYLQYISPCVNKVHDRKLKLSTYEQKGFYREYKYLSSFVQLCILKITCHNILSKGCPQNTFGEECSQLCYCEDGTCSSDYGICPGECKGGYHGVHCNIGNL